MITRASRLINLQLNSIVKKPFGEFLLALGSRNSDLKRGKIIESIINCLGFFELVAIDNEI